MTKALTQRPSAAMAQLFKATGAHRNITVDEVNRARALAKKEGHDTLAMLIDVLWFTGARITEVLALLVRDFDFIGQSVAIHSLKKRKNGSIPQRGVPIPDPFLGPLALFINTHHLRGEDRLIDLKRTRAWSEVKRILLAVGVENDRAFPHAFRHGHALHALKGGVQLNVIKETLGHASIFTTQIYVRASGQDIAQSYKRVTWT